MDVSHLASIARSGPTPLFATISGAHLYGFESPDSDYDLRGAFVAPLRAAIAVREYQETVTLMERRGSLELDWVAHDVKKFALMMTRRNGYVLEQLYSPLVVVGGPWLEELRAIGRGCVVREHVHHYRGFLRTQRGLFESTEPTLKHLLYCHRVALTGVHLMRSGEIESNLSRLAAEYAVSRVPELVARKRAGREKQMVEPVEVQSWSSRLDELAALLERAHDESTLSSEISSWDALDDFVVRVRLDLGRE